MEEHALSHEDIQALNKAWQSVRRLYRKEKLKLFFIMILILPVVIFVDFKIYENNGQFGFFTFGLIFLTSFFVLAKRQECEAKLKPRIISALLPQFGTMTYRQNAGIHPTELVKFKILPGYSSFHTEDFFEGRYKGIDLCFCETRLIQRINNSPVIVFMGLTVLISYEAKKFSSHTVIVANDLVSAIAINTKGPEMKRANMVDPDFERAYSVYTTDQVEARYIIDHLMIDLLKKLNDQMKPSIAFLDQEILMLIPTAHPLFEPTRMNRKTIDKNSFSELKKDIFQVLSIIDTLEIPQKI